MDSGSLSVTQCRPCALYVFLPATGQSSDLRPANLACNELDGGKVTLRGDRKTCLDHVGAECIERLRHAQLLGNIHAAAGRLFAVA